MTAEQSRLKSRLDRVEAHLGLRPSGSKPGPPFYGHAPASGMHRLKDVWNQMEYLVAQCNWLSDELELAISATHAQAPDRPSKGKKFCLKKRISQARPENGRERQLEWDLIDQWRFGNNVSNAEHKLFHRLVGFQVPVYDNVSRDGWDKIDLVGVDPGGEPVVIELKSLKASDKPLRVILEGVAYAIALQKVWPMFCEELASVMTECNPNQMPQHFHVCLLAPRNNWERWEENINNEDGARESLVRLIGRLGEHGFVLRCGSIGKNNELSLVDFP